jgi:short-subunit dehydrogenase
MEKIALVTGASSGLGEAIAKVFKEKGFKIVAVCRSEPKIEVARWLKADISHDGIYKELVLKVQEEFGRLDVLVNAAGKGNYATWEEFDDAGIRDLFELNFFALVNITCAFLPMLKESKGTIINIASIAGRKYIPCMGPYCATKHSVVAFSGSLRAEIKGTGVKVVNVNPGHIKTGFTENSLGIRKFPDFPNLGSSPSGLARRVYKAYQKNWREFTYPRIYNVFIVVAHIFPSFYDWCSRKKWGLDKEDKIS